jgi:hypothetical protein
MYPFVIYRILLGVLLLALIWIYQFTLITKSM